MTLAGIGVSGQGAVSIAAMEMDAMSLEDPFRSPNRDVTVWAMPENSSPRYAGVTSYVSYSVPQSLAELGFAEAEALLALAADGATLTPLHADGQYLAAIPEI